MDFGGILNEGAREAYKQYVTKRLHSKAANALKLCLPSNQDKVLMRKRHSATRV